VTGGGEVVVGELIARVHVQGLVRLELVVAGDHPARQEAFLEVLQRAGDRCKVFLLARVARDLDQGLHGVLGFPAGNGRWLELPRPNGKHLEVVLLAPARLRIGHLRQDEKVPELLQRGLYLFCL